MSIKLMTQVWETSLPSAEKMVLLIIADHANDDGSNSWPGVDTMARRCSCSRRSVQRQLRSLEAQGIITTVKNGGGTSETPKDRRPNRYDIDLAALDGVTICHDGEDESDGATDTTKRGDNDDTTGRQMERDGVTPVSPYPPVIHPEPSVIHLAQNDSDIIEAEIVSDDELAFEAWWKQYPRKKAKQQARRVWSKLSEADRAEAVELLPAHVQRWRSEQTAEKYIPYPERWLKHRRWEDELDTDYQPEGGLLDAAVRYALQQQRQERTDGHRAGNGGTGAIGRGDDRLE